jgi:hypothetical protein
MNKKKEQNYNESFSDFLDAYSNSESSKFNPAFNSAFEQLKDLTNQFSTVINAVPAPAAIKPDLDYYSNHLKEILMSPGRDNMTRAFDYGNAYRRLLELSKPIASENKQIGEINRKILHAYLNLADVSRNKSLAKIAIDLSKNYKKLM